jgi:hypothetical protein
MVWKQKLSKRVLNARRRMRTLNTSVHAIALQTRNKKIRFFAFKLSVLEALIILSVPAVVFASGLTSSTNYQLGEAFFGAGGELDASSPNYQAKEAAGELAVGDTSSANYQAHAGFNTDRQPYIQMTVGNTSQNLGALSTTSTTTTTATFSVETYLAHGYQVVNAAPPPTNGSYVMHAPSVPTASTIGGEEFGINLVANTFPTNFGSNLVDEPDNTFAYGEVTSNYDTPNYYMYAQGDTIADSVSSTSFTIYTISYIFNINHVTPGGTYTFNDVLVATSTY